MSLFSCAFAQEARKIDEFGDVTCADITFRSINFFDEVRKIQNSTGYVIVYNGKLTYNAKDKPLYPHRNEAKSEIENIKTRIDLNRFDKKRVVFIEGGLRDYLTVEFWLVPKNTTPPKPTPTLTKMKYRKGKPKNPCGEF